MDSNQGVGCPREGPFLSHRSGHALLIQLSLVKSILRENRNHVAVDRQHMIEIASTILRSPFASMTYLSYLVRGKIKQLKYSLSIRNRSKSYVVSSLNQGNSYLPMLSVLAIDASIS